MLRVIAGTPKLASSATQNGMHSACRKDKRNTYSRRRKFHADKDVDFINDRNAHFNKKIDRAFGQYTVEVKANLERGTALPEH